MVKVGGIIRTEIKIIMEDIKMTTGKVTFHGLGNVRVSESVDIVIAEVKVDDVTTGLNINSHVKSDRYTGYTRGTFIPLEYVADFQKIIDKVDLV